MDTLSQSTYFPRQRLPMSEKNKEWKHRCVDSVINTTFAYGLTRRSLPGTKRRNYNLFNNKINKADFDYVLNPFNMSKEKLVSYNFPASLQPYDIISPYFHLLLGEESKRPFKPIIRAINEDSVSEKQNKKKEEIYELLKQSFVRPDQEEQQEGDQPPPPPEQLLKYSTYTPKLMRESVSTSLLQHYMRREKLPKLFSECFKDYLVAGEEIVRIDKVGDGPKVTRVNPLEIWYQLNNNEDTLDEAEKIYERNQMTVSEIIDEFYQYLTPEQIDELESYGWGSTNLFNFGDITLMVPEVDNLYAFEDQYTKRGIPVHRVRWASQKKVGYWTYIDENGAPQEALVEEGFKVDRRDPSQSIEWFWIKEYWEGIRIGTDMYLDDLIRPRIQQFRQMDNLSKAKSGYVGNVCSVNNSQSMSLMDRLVPWVYLYLIVWYRTELALAANIGKIGLIDTSLIPDGWEPEKWLHYASIMKIGFVNSYNESNKTLGINGINMSTQNKALDLSTGQYIDQHIKLLEFIEQRIESTSGITRQRLGAIATSELVGNTERAVVQSSHITEPYFAPHDDFKLRVCEALVEVSKECLKGKTKNFEYITDDLASILFMVDGDDFNNSDYGAFMTNSTKDQQALETFRTLMQSAIQNEKVQLSQVFKVLTSDSMAEITQTLIQAEQENAKAAQEAQAAEMQARKEDIAQKLHIEQEKIDSNDYNEEQRRQTDITIATLKALGTDSMGTPENDSVNIIEQGKLALEQRKHEWQRHVDSKKLSIDEKKVQAENARTKLETQENAKDRIHKEKIERIKGKNKPKVKK